ncbi:2Fe-2S iron-sulfur cluster-binding protein [Paramagnetospirillum marisnigri]|uniref:2Fe-2S iron-sulfur cluster-binding protein n=1 Tax=Paramagnetospirillum marisnigri TaxID=1285242 RepID=UPI00155F9A45
MDFAPGPSVRDLLDLTHARVRAACGGTGGCGACRVRLLAGPDLPFTMAEHIKLAADERAAGLRLACQIRPAADIDVALDDPAPQSPWRSLALDHPDRRPDGPPPAPQDAPYG